MINIVIFGAPGSGKGTYSAKIMEHFGYEHISTGDVLREQIRKDTELGRIAKGYIDKGQLIPDTLITDILATTYDSMKDAKGMIFDGFPRTIVQAEALKKMLSERGETIAVTINLIVEEDELMRRLLNRAKIEGRADDNEVTIRKRFEVYHNQTQPLIEWFRNEGVLQELDYRGSREDMENRVVELVEKVIS